MSYGNDMNLLDRLKDPSKLGCFSLLEQQEILLSFGFTPVGDLEVPTTSDKDRMKEKKSFTSIHDFAQELYRGSVGARYYSIGVGKSGIAALAFVRFCESFEIPCQLLDMNSLYHGGLGVLQNDFSRVLIWSDSGETKELFELAQFSNNAFYIGSGIKSPLAFLCGTCLILPKHVWSHGVPEWTTKAQVGVAICIAMLLAKYRGQPEASRSAHPHGVQYHPADTTSAESDSCQETKPPKS